MKNRIQFENFVTLRQSTRKMRKFFSSDISFVFHDNIQSKEHSFYTKLEEKDPNLARQAAP
jgi:ABC-type antimicrobial peptide transport system ATPase subunit